MATLSHLYKSFFSPFFSSLPPKLSFLLLFHFLTTYFISLICLPSTPTVFCPFAPLCLHLQSNSLLPESLRNSDKRRNGPEFPNDTKKRKVDDKDSSHYVRNVLLNAYVCVVDSNKEGQCRLSSSYCSKAAVLSSWPYACHLLAELSFQSWCFTYFL